MKGKKILVIDDDPDIINYFKKFFTTREVQLFNCSTLLECVENFDEYKPDLILLDLKLEFESGVDFLKYRESLPSLMDTPVIVISSHTNEDLVKECIEHGIKDFIKKPFISFEQIEERVNKILIAR